MSVQTPELADEREQNCMTTEEVERTMRTLEPLYDIVRLVDPSPMEGRTLNMDGTLAAPHSCHALLNKGRRCHNCISARTLSCHDSVSKFEIVGDNTYYITTRYLVVDGEPRSLELVRRITDDLLLGNSTPTKPATSPADASDTPDASDASADAAGSDAASEDHVCTCGAHGEKGRAEGVADAVAAPAAAAPANGLVANALRNAMLDDSERRYLDATTCALDPRYLQEGIGELQGSCVALLELMNLTQVDRESRAALLACTAKAIRSGIRDKDTLVRLGEGLFAIVFEGIPQHLLLIRLEGLRQRVTDAVAEELEGVSANLAIGATIGSDTINNLIDVSRKALSSAQKNPGRIVIVDEGAREVQHSQLAPVPTGGALAHDVDALTGLPLPSAFRHGLQRRIDHIESDADALLVVHMDIESFKSFNRAYGLLAGDELLIQFVAAVRDEFPDDLITRTGVDMLDVATHASDVPARLKHLRGLIRSQRRDTPLILKAGVFKINDHELAANQAMDRAKIACDSIKGKFDLTVRYYDKALQRKISMHEHLIQSLDDALANDYIRPYYQAIVRGVTGKACAVEALSRWVDPMYGTISPADVIPTLEERHLIHKHDIHIMECVCRDLRNLIDEGRTVLPVSVNLSRLDFQLCDIFQKLEDVRERYGIDRSLLTIEITESALDLGGTEFSQMVNHFRHAGYDVWMDDFGSGYSSLNLLKDYDFDVLKIDMEFLRGLESSPAAQEILASLVDMSKRIGVRTLVEGVETENQRHFLRGIGIEMLQGYLFARPTPLDELDLDGTLGVEPPEARTYFERVGRVNLLSQQPTQAVNPTSKSGSRGMPLGILERDGNGYFRFLSANDAYFMHLCTANVDGTDEAERLINESPEMQDELSYLFDRYADTPEPHIVHSQLDEVTCRYELQFVARTGDTVAFLINPDVD